MIEQRWWHNVPQFREAQRDPGFCAWVEALDLGIDLCVDTPADWFPGIPDADWFGDDAIGFVERAFLASFPDSSALWADTKAFMPFLKYLGQAYVDKLDATWITVPQVAGRWRHLGWGVELPWRFDWFVDLLAALDVSVRRRSGDQWLLAFGRHRQDRDRWRGENVVIDRSSKSVPAGMLSGTDPAGRPYSLGVGGVGPIDTPAIVRDEDRHRLIRDLAIAELARNGLIAQVVDEVPRGDEELVDNLGNHFVLVNLQLECDTLPPSEWDGAVEYRIRQLLASRGEPEVAQLSDADLSAQVRTRLEPPDPSGVVSERYSRPAFDGLVVVLRRDLPTVVTTLSDADLRGRDLDLLYQRGQQNTDAEPVTVTRLEHDVYALSGDSFFIASKALNIPHLIETVLGGAAPFGVLFSAPHRSLMFLHAVGEATIPALNWIASATVGQALAPPGGPVSYDTYFWQLGQTQRVTTIDPVARSIGINVDGAFGEVMNQHPSASSG